MNSQNKVIIFDIGHPANVHIFKNIYRLLEDRGWMCYFTLVNKDVTSDLLIAYDLKFFKLGDNVTGLLRKLFKIPMTTYKFAWRVLLVKPSIIISRGSLHSSIVAKILRIPHIVLTDTEAAGRLNKISNLLADSVMTSNSYQDDCGMRHIRYPGYHELFYLHPNRFKPNFTVLELIGLKPSDRYAVIRFVSWTAHHDVGQSGFSLENKISLISLLSKYIPVLISVEGIIPSEFQDKVLRIDPTMIHDVLYYAEVFVGESATMAEEAALLGTPAIYVNSLKGGIIRSIEDYGLLFAYSNGLDQQQKAIDKALELVGNNSIKSKLKKNKDKLIREKIDMTAFLLWFIEDYPDSHKDLIKGKIDFDVFR